MSNEIKFDPHNYRIHNDHNKKLIEKSLKECGAGRSILIDADNEIIAGNGVYEAAQKANIKIRQVETDGSELIVVKRTDLRSSDDKRKQLAIMDNSTSDSSDFDFTLLEQDFDLDTLTDFGITLPDIDIDLDDEDAEQEEYKELTDEQNMIIDEVYKRYAGELLQVQNKLLEIGYFDSSIIKTASEIYFLLSLYQGKRYKSTNNFAFHPHIINTAGKGKHSLVELLERIVAGTTKPYAIKLLGRNIPCPMTLYSSSSPIDGRMPRDFLADLAKALYCEFGNKGKVLDPCHGWGGRVVGFMLSDCEEYVGYDPSPKTFVGVKEIIQNFNQYTQKKIKTHNLPFEDSDEQKDYFDLVMTSPPYFDVELYDGVDSSTERYQSFNLWVDRFYKVLIKKSYDYLKPGGHLILQVGNQVYQLGAIAKSYCAQLGFDFVEERFCGANSHFSEGKDDREERGENIYIFKK